MKRLIVSTLTIALLAVPMVASTASAATPKCNGVKATIVGTNKANILRGTRGRDVIVARGGADKIYGRGGRDLICAGKGKDVVFAGAGNDKVFGQGGNDKLKGGAGFDMLNGGPKTDACYVNAGGGKMIDCEEADLLVTVTSPASITSGGVVSHTIRVKNVGSKPAPAVKVVFDYIRTNVFCGEDLSGTKEIGWLRPGGSWKWDPWQICSVDRDEPRTVTMKASASTTATEEVLANNKDESTTTVLAKS